MNLIIMHQYEMRGAGEQLRGGVVMSCLVHCHGNLHNTIYSIT